VAASIAARDRADSTRTASPLTIAPGAVYIDTTDLPIDRVVDTVMALVRQRSS
jgi:cytidylate kinase